MPAIKLVTYNNDINASFQKNKIRRKSVKIRKVFFKIIFKFYLLWQLRTSW